MEDINYAEAYRELLNKGYTPEHLRSLPKIVKLPEDIMMNEILQHLDYQDIMTICASSHEYYKMCEKHHVLKNIYHQHFKSKDFLPEPEDYVERIIFLKKLITLHKALEKTTTLEKFYKRKTLDIKKSWTKMDVQNNIDILTNLQELNITYANMTNLPLTICNLTNLTQLNLQDNKLIELPEEIDKLINLKDLYLSTNKLTTLPSSIGNLVNLDELYINYNQLITLPENIGQLTKLTHLYLNNNKIKKLPSSICHLTNLYSLQINYNYITKLPSCIDQLANLQWLYIRNNPIKYLPDSFKNMSVENVYLNKSTMVPEEYNPKYLKYY